MNDEVQFSRLSKVLGVKNGARYGTRSVTIGAVGWRDRQMYAMGTFRDGTVVLGEPRDFTIPEKFDDGDAA